MTGPLSELIASHPDVATKLIAEHRDDGTGHCRACPIGAQAGYHTFPCALYTIAVRARDQRSPDDGAA